MCVKVGELWDFPDLPQPPVLFRRSSGSAHHYSISATCWLRRETAAITAPTAGGADKKPSRTSLCNIFSPYHTYLTLPPSGDTRSFFFIFFIFYFYARHTARGCQCALTRGAGDAHRRPSLPAQPASPHPHHHHQHHHQHQHHPLSQ